MEKGIGPSSLRRWILFAVLMVVAVGIYALPWMFWQLQTPVKSRCAQAQEEFGGDCVDALIEVLESDDHSYLRKNRAVWVLGQLADERALPVLRGLQTGVPCQRPCRKSTHQCQYELEKAIKWCEKGTLFSRWMRASVLEAGSD